MTSAVTIRRLVGRARPGAGAASRVEQLLREVADHRLADALREATLPPGDWCVRRVDLQLVWDDTRPDAATSRTWAAAIVTGLLAALEGGSPDVVHYRTPELALADVVTAVVRRDASRAWAWRRLGLTRGGDPDPAADPAGFLAAVLARAPDAALGAVVTAVGIAGAAALHRMLGPAGWTRLAALVLRGSAPEACVRPADPDPYCTATGAGPAPATPTPADPPAPPPPPSSPRAAAALTGSRLAVALRALGVRPDPETARAWAVLVLAEADPGALRGPGAPLVTEVAHRLADGVTRPGLGGAARPVPPGRRPGGPGTPPDADAPRMTTTGGRRPFDDAEHPTRGATDVGRDDAGAEVAPPSRGPSSEPEAPPAEVEGAATAWAGLLYLVGCAEAAGVPESLFAEPALQDRSSRWVLHRLAQLLVPAEAHDPAVLAFAGLVVPQPPPTATDSSPGELAALHRWARRWAERAAVALDRLDENSADVVVELAARPGRIVGAPGWLEVHLDLDAVDVAVRRAGLDLDPGWVPWLGTVVRFVYA